MIRISPTKQLIGYIVVLVLCVTPAVMVNTAAGYLPVLLLLFFGILSCGQLILVRNKLEIDVSDVSGSRFRGDASAFVIRLTNRSILPISNIRGIFYIRGTRGEDQHIYPIHLTMSPKEERSFEVEADFAHIGVFEAGLEEVIVFDLLGILKAVCPVGSASRVEILPHEYYMESLPVSDQTQYESNRSITSSALSGYDYAGVREYAFGDPMKMIQWKLSAHTNTLMTKQMETYSNVGLTTVLDFRVPLYQDEEMRLSMLDGVVETGVAVGAYARRHGLDYDLVFYGEHGKRREFPFASEDFAPFLDEMHMRGDVKATGFNRILREDCAQVHAQTNVVLCTAWLDESIASALLYLKQCGKNPILIFLMPDLIHDREKEKLLRPLHSLQRSNIHVIVASSAEGVVKA
ncbi:MAG: DUF58 domain-containing protein [Clostridiales bacterium]|nr:DUF58 domain-containing protein [Clostridiales bacterium]